jgi:general secretion pathway protein A
MTTDTSPHFFGYFGLRENPFHISPNHRFYHSTPNYDSAQVELLFGLQTRQGLLVLTGEAGTGKTTLLHSILESLAKRAISTAYVFHPLLEPVELFECILRDFGVSCDSHRKVDLLQALHDWLISREAAGDFPVVIIDEAQSLSLPMLDELRLLLNLETPSGKLLQLILAGQSKLEEKLRRPELRQLRQRVMFHSRLSTLSEEQTAAYVQTRLAHAGSPNRNLFPPAVLQSIHTYARGIPRVINLLCQHALIAAYGQQSHSIAPEAIQRIAADFDLASNPIAVEREFSGARAGRFTSFSRKEAQLEPLLPFEKPSPLMAAQSNGTEIERILWEVSPPPPPPKVTDQFASFAYLTTPVVDPVYLTSATGDRAPGPTPTQAATAPRIELGAAKPPGAAANPSNANTTATPPQEYRSKWRSYRTPFHFPQIRLSRFNLPHFRLANFKLPKLNLPKFKPHDFKTPQVTLPNLALPTFVKRSVTAFAGYWREVARSFVRDIRYLFRPITTATQSHALAGAGNQQSSSSRNLLQPLAHWLRQPMNNGRSHRLPPPNRSSSTK